MKHNFDIAAPNAVLTLYICQSIRTADPNHKIITSICYVASCFSRVCQSIEDDMDYAYHFDYFKLGNNGM